MSLFMVQAASIILGLPMSILLCFLVQSVSLFFQAAVYSGVQDFIFPSQPEFDMPVYGGIFNAMEYLVSFGCVNPSRVELGIDRATSSQLVEAVKGLVLPFISLNQRDLPSSCPISFVKMKETRGF
jgi:hypothetical protein